MRELADAARIRRLMEALGAAAPADGRVYFTGGATAVLMGWRRSTIDVDLPLVTRDRTVATLPKDPSAKGRSERPALASGHQRQVRRVRRRSSGELPAALYEIVAMLAGLVRRCEHTERQLVLAGRPGRFRHRRDPLPTPTSPSPGRGERRRRSCAGPRAARPAASAPPPPDTRGGRRSAPV